MLKWVIGGLAALALVAAGIGFVRWQWPDPRQIYIFQGVSGPSKRSVIAPPRMAKIADYERGGPHRLAILVTDETSGWLGLVLAFKSHGVPVTVTRDPARALRHKVVFVYPLISGRTVTPANLRAMSAHVRSGGTLMTFNLAGGGLQEVFGVTGVREGRERSTVDWARPSGIQEEDQIRISREGMLAMGTVGYVPSTATVLGTFNDGTAAITCREAGGRACLVGVDIGSLAGRVMNGRGEPIARAYVNAYEPGLDVLVRHVRDLYVQGEPYTFLLSTAPAGAEVSMVFTHDVDFTRSVTNAYAYQEMLRPYGISGTFFIQTKYIRDYNDDIFFNAQTTPAIRALSAAGGELGSHTVAHSAVLAIQHLGSGRERYPLYRPFVETRRSVRGATVMGEVRVSKFLLEKFGKTTVVSFRPGELSYPFNLPEVLQASGYKYSSSITANSTLTHLPYQLTYERQNGALTSIYEFPVTIEDELPPALPDRLEVMDGLIQKIARHQGMVVMLMHPNITGKKLAFEETLVRRWRNRAWMGSLSQFGDWWTARDALELDVVVQNGRPVLMAAAGPATRAIAVKLPKSTSAEIRLDLRAGERRETPIG